MTRTQAIAKLKRVEEEIKLFRQSLEEGYSVETGGLLTAGTALNAVYRNRHWWGEGMAVVDLTELKANIPDPALRHHCCRPSFGPIKGCE